MTAAVLSIGTELTRGEIVNTNASWLAAELARLGLDVTAIDTVPDDPALIAAALARLGAAHEAIVCTGGLGPTTDDITAACVASHLGVPLVRDEASLEAIRGRMARFGRTVAASNAKQADFPQGATVLPNAHGTAPGFSARLARATAFFLPGVPGEMKPMFRDHVEPALAPLVVGGLHQIHLHTFGWPESTVNDRLTGIEEEHGVIIGYRAHFPEIEVKVLARAADAVAAAERAERAARVVRERLAEVLYGEGDSSLAEVVVGLARGRGLTLATAESCTGGLLAELVTDVPGASEVFRGAVVAYSNDVKQAQLGVDPELLAANGAVSEEVAVAMAEGARRALGADAAVGITGIAGPGGGTPEKPVGLVHLAAAGSGGVLTHRAVFPGSRRQVRTLAAWAGLSLLRRLIGPS